MKTDKIQTAEEYFVGEFQNIVLKDKCNKIIEFTKLHVQAALEAACRDAEAYIDSESFTNEVDENSILNAYPLELIK